MFAPRWPSSNGRGHRIGALAALLLAATVLPATVLADDPSPTPVVFPQPHFLVWMDDHGTIDGLVQDQAYWLYPYPPDNGTDFRVPDGNGGVYHYRGHVVSGPYSSDTDACPAMIALGIDSLETWATHAGESPMTVDCRRFRAPADTPAAATTGPEAGTGSGVTTGSDTEPDPESLGIAVALIGLLLFGGGAAGVVIGGRTRPIPDFGPGARSDIDTHQQPDRPAPDPCADEAAAVSRASLQGRYLNGLLASGRHYEAILQAEIDRLANLVLPGSVLLDLGFAAGGLSGGLGPKIAAKTFLGALGEAVGKDVIKDLAKQGLGSDAFEPGATAGEGGLSAAKQVLLTAIRDSIVNRKFFGELSPASPVRAFPDFGSYVQFEKQLEGFADDVAGPIADGVGAMLDLYSGVMDGLALKDKLDHLRGIRDQIADQTANLEVRLESAIEAQQFAADRLTHCRTINAPGWRP